MRPSGDVSANGDALMNARSKPSIPTKGDTNSRPADCNQHRTKYSVET